jgi:hypothetical protein
MTETAETPTEAARSWSRDREMWLRRGCALIVAAVAAYGSYEHQRDFALHGGADPVTAGLWPLSVDGLLLLATVGLLKSSQHTSRRVQLAVWLSFLLGIAVSLAANIAAAPTLAWQPVLVAGWPPVALLLAAELLTHHPQPPKQADTDPAAPMQESNPETAKETEPVISPRKLAPKTSHAATPKRGAKPAAEQVMWEHFAHEQARGHTPTGAELDRIAGTNNYGRTVLRRWRQQGRIPSTNPDRRNGHHLVPGPGGTR